MVPFRRLDALALATCVGLGASVLLSCATIWNEQRRRSMVDGFLTGSVSFAEIDGADDTATQLALVALIVMIVTGLVFLVWRHRAQANLRDSLAVRGLEYTPGWAVGWWFVPFANLVKPKQAMNEAWVASDPATPAWSSRGRTGKAPAMLSWWWACWIVSAIASQFASSITNGDTVTPDSYQQAMNISTFAEVASIAGALLLVTIVRQITARQSQRASVLGVPRA
jgi:hypothetical protein